MPTITFPNDEGEDVTIPARYDVCDRCRGEGKHVNPNIDGDGLPEEWVNDPEFMDDYLNGFYDVLCEECHGDRVVPVVDVQRTAPELLRAYELHLQDEADYRQEVEMERRMGA